MKWLGRDISKDFVKVDMVACMASDVAFLIPNLMVDQEFLQDCLKSSVLWHTKQIKKNKRSCGKTHRVFTIFCNCGVMYVF